MIRNRDLALKLRLRGLSYNEINKRCGISKSTLSYWFSDLSLSENAKRRLLSRVKQGTLNGLIKRNRLQTVLSIQRTEAIKQKSKKSIKPLTKYSLLMIGALLYWGEGYKRLRVVNGKEKVGHIISLTNSDPNIISVFILFLKNILNIPKDKIKLNIRIFKHISSDSAIRYWQSVSGLNKSNIEKPVYVISLSSQGKRPFNRLPYGTAQVRVLSTDKFYEIMGMIEGIKNNVASYDKLD